MNAATETSKSPPFTAEELSTAEEAALKYALQALELSAKIKGETARDPSDHGPGIIKATIKGMTHDLRDKMEGMQSREDVAQWIAQTVNAEIHNTTQRLRDSIKANHDFAEDIPDEAEKKNMRALLDKHAQQSKKETDLQQAEFMIAVGALVKQLGLSHQYHAAHSKIAGDNKAILQ